MRARSAVLLSSEENPHGLDAYTEQARPRVSDAREHAPQPYLPSEEQPGDPIIPQER